MGLFSNGSKATTTKPTYTGLQVQTAVNTLPIPVGWGRFKVAPNIIWYENFQQHSNSQQAGGKGGAAQSSTTYTYSADVILGICEGPITAVDKVWKNTYVLSSLAKAGLSLFAGGAAQAGWGYLYTKYPSQALSYPGTAYACAANYDLHSSASLQSHNFEVLTPLAGTGSNGIDADPAQVIEDFLANAQYGCQFPSSSIDASTLLSSAAAATTGDATLQTYCRAVGLAFSPCLSSVETAQSVLQRWIKLLNVAVVVSGGMVRFIPYGDEAVTGNGVTYLPNLTPIFDLDDDDFQGDASGDPLQMQITDIFEAYNVERLTINSRAAAYNSVPIEARDEAAIDAYGLRIDTSVSANEFCDPAVAAISAQLILQRGLYVRNTSTIKLDWRYCGLDPMDVITLTDAALGMNHVAVRIAGMEEADDGTLTVTIEELPAGIATASAYPKEDNSAAGPVVDNLASPVNAPIIFEPPPAMTSGQAQVWIGASGSAGGVADPLWGGANVYLSTDNVTYEYAGSIGVPARQGVLTTNLATFTGANPDSADTLNVDMTMSGGQLANAASAYDAANGSTACFVDGEVISFLTATLTTDNQYALASLYRAQNGTGAAAHLAGAQFARLDDAFFIYDLPAAYVGRTLYAKLASFDGQGGGLQDLSDCAAYAYVPLGSGLLGPVTTSLAMGLVLDFGLITEPVVESDDFGSVLDGLETPVDLGMLT